MISAKESAGSSWSYSVHVSVGGGPCVARVRADEATLDSKRLKLWDEIAEEVSRRPLTEMQRRLLDERLSDEEQNPGDVESWTKAKADILRDL